MSAQKEIPLPLLPEGVSLIDTHCHLDMKAYAGDLEQVLARAAGAGVRQVLSIGIDLESSRRAVALAGRHEGVFAAVGIHPHHVEGVGERDYEELRDLAAAPRVVGYGEIGIDLVKQYAPAPLQLEHFRRQIRLARDLVLPLIIHDRGAHKEVMAVLREEGPFPAGGVMHCFSGDAALAREVVALGFHISVPGVVTFNKAETLQEAVRATPLDRLLVETDGPFLAPVPYRGKRNEPACVLYTAQKVAELKKTDLAVVARATTANARRLFRLEG
ncbi:MAG: TatD family hydrolase [Desulfobacteraceae bacterium]|nr:TatD family hydrolase [Desulfobacteraceae bacterium]